MNSIGGKSKYIAFMDECGDHSLTKIDKDFPVFLLATIVVERTDYAERHYTGLGKAQTGLLES